MMTRIKNNNTGNSISMVDAHIILGFLRQINQYLYINDTIEDIDCTLWMYLTARLQRKIKTKLINNELVRKTAVMSAKNFDFFDKYVIIKFSKLGIINTDDKPYALALQSRIISLFYKELFVMNDELKRIDKQVEIVS